MCLAVALCLPEVVCDAAGFLCCEVDEEFALSVLVSPSLARCSFIGRPAHCCYDELVLRTCNHT